MARPDPNIIAMAIFAMTHAILGMYAMAALNVLGVVIIAAAMWWFERG